MYSATPPTNSRPKIEADCIRYYLFYICSLIIGQTVCKPGSVPPALKDTGMDDHSSGTAVTDRLARPTRTTTRKPVRHHPERHGWSSLFGLAPGGVYHADPVAGAAVRSYRTLSPLPIFPLETMVFRQAVCFLWHFP